MIKKYYLVLVLLLSIPLVSADWFLTSQQIFVNLDISSELGIKRTSSNSRIDYLTVNLSFFPKDFPGQDILSVQTDPEAVVGEVALYRWDNPAEDELSFGLNTDVKVTNSFVKVKEKVAFPVQDIPDHVLIYTSPSMTIDSDNPSIFQLANELAEGEDDLYKVVFKLASWVKTNVAYDLSTITADVSQTSSWVLEHREGVCDEITNLFIALNRALGIPARFVSGVSYTDSDLFVDKWGAHGWAEVYFPGYRWIPFDVTYGEFGFVDPAHIKLKETLDADDASVRYQWLGKNVEIESKRLDVKTTLTDTVGKISPLVSVEISPLKSSVGFGSYNLLEVKIKNLNDFYVANELYIAKSNEIELVEKERIPILLEPSREKSLYWILNVSDNLDKTYIYNFPVSAISVRNVSAASSFSSAYGNPVYELSEMQAVVMQKHEEEEKTYSKSVDLVCLPDKTELYEYELIKINCEIKNLGNVLLNDLDVCLVNDCKRIDLGIGMTKSISFAYTPNQSGTQDLVVGARNLEVSKTDYVVLDVLDEPDIEITDVQHPSNVDFGQTFQVSFILNKVSRTIPKNVVVELDQSGFLKTWELNQLNKDKQFIINLNSKDLGVGANKIWIKIKYYDKNKEYLKEKGFFITLNEVNILQRIHIFFMAIPRFFSRLIR